MTKKYRNLQRHQIAKSREMLREQIAELERENEELQEKLDAAKSEEAIFEELEDILLEIRYWFRDVLDLHRPMRDPRKILQMVERGLGL